MTVGRMAGMGDSYWRVGRHYGVHVYEGDRPVATFHSEEDAKRAVVAVSNGQIPGLGQRPMTPTRAVALVVAAVVTVAGVTVWLWADGPCGDAL